MTRAEEVAQAERTPVTPKRLAKALHAVLEYNWRDEEEDFLGGEHEATPKRAYLWLTHRPGSVRKEIENFST